MPQYPKDFKARAKWRASLMDSGNRDPLTAEQLKHACASDILLWINAFGATYDPRLVDEGKNPVIPFFTWEFQDEAILSLSGVLGKEDMVIEKSRDMGASWICLLVMMHAWQFKKNRAFMLVSRKEDLVDKPNDPDCLFWKLDHVLRLQPPWMRPKFERTKLHLGCLDTLSVFDGASTTADVGRGGRRTAFLVDEFAAFEHSDGLAVLAAVSSNTNSVIYNSTPKGAVGAFYTQAHNDKIKRLTLHWTSHPEKSKGLYFVEGQTSPHPEVQRRFPQGRPRSPWYDDMCLKRLPIPALQGQELDIDYAGSVSQFFPSETIDRLVRETGQNPYHIGILEKGIFREQSDGQLLLWTHPKDSKPPADVYVIACDVATGRGATNSVMSVGSVQLREKIAEYATPHLSPEQFARLVFEYIPFFHNAYVIWENNGPGLQFGKELVEILGYRNVYWQRNEKSLEKRLSEQLVPGWNSTPQNKMALLSKYRDALANDAFINRSRPALNECRTYVFQPGTGRVESVLALASNDPSGARSNHADRATADALVCMIVGEQAQPFVEKVENQVLYGSWLWRRKEYEREQKELKDESLQWASPSQDLRGWD